MSGVSLNLYGRLAQSTTARVWPGYDLAALIRDYYHINVANGGYLLAGGKLSGDDLTSAELSSFYNKGIGWRMVETSPMISFEGQNTDMRLSTDGAVYQQTLDQTYFRNRIKVKYMSDIAAPAQTAWAQNADSVAIFGEANHIESLGGATAAGATDERDRQLAEWAWPDSREIAGDAREVPSNASLPDELEIKWGGYWGTLNWRIRQTNIAATTASSIVTTLTNASQFVTPSRIETNSASRTIDAVPIFKGLGDAIMGIVSQGDGNAKIWQAGVYEDRGLVYEPAPTKATYILKGEQLLNQAEQPVNLAAVRAGFLVFNPNAPSGWERPGVSNVWNDPKIAYVERVTYRRGEKPGVFDSLEMKFKDVPQGSNIIARQIREGSFGA